MDDRHRLGRADLRLGSLGVPQASRRLILAVDLSEQLRFLSHRFLSLFACGAFLALVQALEYRCHDERQTNRGVYEYFSEFSALCRRHKLSPRNRLAVRASRQATPIHGLRTDAQAIVIALERQ